MFGCETLCWKAEWFLNRIKKVKGKYYLTERVYDKGNKKVVERSLGPIDLIKQLLYEHK